MHIAHAMIFLFNSLINNETDLARYVVKKQNIGFYTAMFLCLLISQL